MIRKMNLRSKRGREISFTPSLENGVTRRVSTEEKPRRATLTKAGQHLFMSRPRKNATPFFSAGFIEKLLSEKYHLFDSSAAARDIARILRGEPLDYVIGWTPFLDLTIDLSLKPFIPRTETEYWVGEAVKELQKRFQGRSVEILDIFSGSGCIGIAVLKHIPKSRVTFSEKTPRFVEQIKINSIKNKLPARRYRVCRSDFFSNIKGQFDVILANPPYVGSLHHLDPEVKKYEPRVAYYGGRGGLSAIKRFLKEARPFVKPGGEIWMEFGMSQKTAIQGILRRLGYRSFSFRRDQYRRPRYVVIRV
ncbi:MAG: peptide chain release factor N(5)-glutamine methyltransferase [Candidatus Sungiibacteriota bacterium]